MINMLRREADPWILRWRRDDPEARAFLLGLFAPTEECIQCTEPIGGGDYVPVFVDDRRNPEYYIVAPRCMWCSRAPDFEQRDTAMLSAMFPGGKWRLQKPKRDEAAGYMRGPKIKVKQPVKGEPAFFVAFCLLLAGELAAVAMLMGQG